MMRSLKKQIRSLLPESLYYALRCIKMQPRLLAAKAKIFLHIPLKERHDKINFGIHLAEHCNLNCASCDNFSPIAEPELVSVEEFTRDFTRMGEIFNHECSHIELIGGEPLLNPNINALMKIARGIFTKGNIYILTNGTLLSQKENEFWQICHDENIGIKITAYPIKIDEYTIRNQAQKFGVYIEWLNWGKEKSEKHDTFSLKAVNLVGDGNEKLNFAMCGRGNGCVMLSHGRLYPCTFASNIRHFNKFFKQNIKLTEEDSIDIYSGITADEILRKLSRPIPVCRYCSLTKPLRSVKWGVSKKDINEWV